MYRAGPLSGSRANGMLGRLSGFADTTAFIQLAHDDVLIA